MKLTIDDNVLGSDFSNANAFITRTAITSMNQNQLDCMSKLCKQRVLIEYKCIEPQSVEVIITLFKLFHRVIDDGPTAKRHY